MRNILLLKQIRDGSLEAPEERVCEGREEFGEEALQHGCICEDPTTDTTTIGNVLDDGSDTNTNTTSATDDDDELDVDVHKLKLKFTNALKRKQRKMEKLAGKIAKLQKKIKHLEDIKRL
ncbi:hypothetical protein MUCCIDRAFT_104308 [Mucor lusitanicus CBS 277.49]|uniref:Uncharacterized protein n=2 Tax=Mucor circinelloides f. lusitanicus TaxID=29924 RepID=A0A162TV29_MUCCL|nr:hypothetical protein MUCCIDRAFT_104308 [Mucor lusitanicus CBS 277.49]